MLVIALLRRVTVELPSLVWEVVHVQLVKTGGRCTPWPVGHTGRSGVTYTVVF